jgi:hypothetical protein
VLRPLPAAVGEAAVSLAKAGAGFLLLSLPARVATEAEPWLPLLAAAAERSEAVVVALAEEAPRPLAHASSLSVAVERTTWKIERGELVGLRARLTCVKNKVSSPGRMAEIEVNYPLGPGLYPEVGLGEVRAWVQKWTPERESAVV